MKHPIREKNQPKISHITTNGGLKNNPNGVFGELQLTATHGHNKKEFLKANIQSKIYRLPKPCFDHFLNTFTRAKVETLRIHENRKSEGRKLPG
jgi:hypothetical protein